MNWLTETLRGLLQNTERDTKWKEKYTLGALIAVRHINRIWTENIPTYQSRENFLKLLHGKESNTYPVSVQINAGRNS